MKNAISVVSARKRQISMQADSLSSTDSDLMTACKNINIFAILGL
jgi:hypothetical protein